MRRVNRLDKLDTIEAPQDEQTEQLATVEDDSQNVESIVPPDLEYQPKPQPEQTAQSSQRLFVFDKQSPTSSFVSGADPSQKFEKDEQTEEKENESIEPAKPIVDSNYTRYSDFDRRKRLLEERERSIQVITSVRPKPLTGKLKKFVSKLKRKDEFAIPKGTEPERNPFETLLPKDEHGHSAVYGLYQGEAIHGPVAEDNFYTNYDLIGTKYREAPGTRLQQSLPFVFGFADKPLIESQIKFLKEKGITFQKKLGVGGYGEVWLVSQHLKEWNEGKKTTTDRILACKILTLRHMEKCKISLEEAIPALSKETDVYLHLEHFHIVKKHSIINLFDEESLFPRPITVLIFMEKMDGDLFGMLHWEQFDFESKFDFYNLQKQIGWTDNPEKFTHLWCKQIVSGLRYLHQNNISHMDLKPENILYSTHKEGGLTKYVFKLTDFGLSLKFDENAPNEYSKQIGTVGYRAPEVISGVVFETKPADIYSLGATMTDSIAGDSHNANNVIQAVKHYDYRVGQIYKISRSFAKLVASMLHINPGFRPTIVELFHNEWIQLLYPDQEYAEEENTKL